MDSATYDRQPGESAPAWQAFQCYRDLGPERSLAKAATKLQRSKRMLERWCSCWNWVTRCADWDAEQDRLTREAFAKARQEKAQQTMKDLELFQGLARRRYVELAKKIQEMPEAIQEMDLDEARLIYLECEKLKRVLMGDPAAIEETRHTGPGGKPLTITVEQVVAAQQQIQELRRSRQNRKEQENGTSE